MGAADIRDAFEAYASGRLAEYELRDALRAAIQAQPDSVPLYLSMAAALRRRNLISAGLEAAVISDMEAVAANAFRVSTSQEELEQPLSSIADDSTLARSIEELPRMLTERRGPGIVIKADPEPGSAEAAALPAAAEPETSASAESAAESTPEPSMPLPLEAAADDSAPVAGSTNPGSTNPGNAGRGSTGPGARNTGPGAAWDTQEKLAEPEAPVTIGLVLRERFELVEVLGRGGMGVVYKALDRREVENRGRDPYVAIKVLDEEFKRHPESARSLQRESKKAMRLAHPNIVLVRDFDRDRGNVYMVMELLQGRPLDQLIYKQYPKGMPIEQVLDIVNGLGAALSYAHQQGILHADFKPSNAFLTTQGVVKVLDFGVARAALALDRGDSTLFDPAKLNAVSPAYASIEMLTGGAPDPSDDIYALACVTYFLLTGRHPFNGIDAIKARDSALVPLPVRGLDDHRWRALLLALVFERWERTGSVKEFVAQFCGERPSRTAKLASQAATLASQAANLASRAGELANPVPKLTPPARKLAAVVREKPWLIAAPAGVMLAVGIALLASWSLHRLSQKEPPSAAATAPASAASAPILTAPPPDLSSSIQQLERRLNAIDPSAADFIDRLLAQSADVESLIALAPADEAVVRLQNNLQAALAGRVKALLMRNDSSGARKLVTRVGELLPPGALKSYSVDGLAKRQSLFRLEAAPEPSQAWAEQLNASLRSFAGLLPIDDPLLKEARDLSDRTFTQAADDARAHQHLEDAKQFLALGLLVNQQSSELARRQAELLDQQQGEPAPSGSEVAGAPTPAPAASTGPTVVENAGAAKVAEVLRGSANPQPQPRANPQQQAIDNALQEAKQQMADGNPALALQTIATARRKFAGSPQLKSLEITYDRVAEEVERINMAPSLNVNDHQQWINEIRELAGDEYPAIEQMLARTVANDIADQRARSNRPAVVASLLESGRKLFPQYANQLEHGTAGVLDPSQIVVAEEPDEPSGTNGSPNGSATAATATNQRSSQ